MVSLDTEYSSLMDMESPSLCEFLLPDKPIKTESQSSDQNEIEEDHHSPTSHHEVDDGIDMQDILRTFNQEGGKCIADQLQVTWKYENSSSEPSEDNAIDLKEFFKSLDPKDAKCITDPHQIHEGATNIKAEQASRFVNDDNSNHSNFIGVDDDDDDDDDHSLDEYMNGHTNISCLTDLSWSLSAMRPEVSRKLGSKIGSLPFWLNDAIIEDSASLADQCTVMEGRVMVKLSYAMNRLTIIDVLSTNETDKADFDDDLSVGPATPFSDVSSPTSKRAKRSKSIEKIDNKPSFPSSMKNSNQDESLNMNFIKSSTFNKIRKEKGIPEKVSSWTISHTRNWARWVRHTFSGSRMDLNEWTMTGADLLKLSFDTFSRKVKDDQDHRLWMHFDQLRKTNEAFVPIGLEKISSSSESSFQETIQMPELPQPALSVTQSQTAMSSRPKNKVVLGKYVQGNVVMNVDENSSGMRTGNNGISTQLWKFLLEKLTDRRYRHLIHWVTGPNSLDGEFMFKEPEKVAQLWGRQKGKENMTYEKLSRALRYYKGGNILDKVVGKRFHYAFVCDLKQLIGYTARQMDAMLQEQISRLGPGTPDDF